MTNITPVESSKQEDIPMATQSNESAPVTENQKRFLTDLVARGQVKQATVDGLKTRAEASALLTALQARANTTQLNKALVYKLQQFGVRLTPVQLPSQSSPVHLSTEHSSRFQMQQAGRDAIEAVNSGADAKAVLLTLIEQTIKISSTTAEFNKLLPDSDHGSVNTASMFGDKVS